MKRKLTTLTLVAVAITGAMTLSGCGEPKLTTSEITIEAGDELEMSAEDYFNTKEDNYDKITFDTSEVDTSVPGEYEVTATYNEKTEYTIKVTVEDTVAPQMSFESRYVFTNDVAKIDTDFVEVKDKTDCTVEFTGFERIDNPVEEMTDEKLNSFTEDIVIPGNADELSAITDMDVTEEGLYRGVVKATDLGGNETYEEVLVVYDTTAPLFADIEDETVEQEDVTAEPSLDESKYTATDNFDGDVDTTVSITCTDEENHQYTVTATATDRAGNEGSKDYIINVTEKKEEVASKSDTSSSNTSSSSSGSSSGSSASTSSTSSGTSSAESSSASSDIPTYDYAALAAKWGVNTVHYDEDGCFTLVNSSSDANYGNELVMNYLNSLGLTSVNGGCYGYYYNDTGYYMCIVPASEIVTIESTMPEIVDEITPNEDGTPIMPDGEVTEAEPVTP